MEKDFSGKILCFSVHPKLIDDLNYLSSILNVDFDILICDAIKMYLSAMQICTHRIMDSVELGSIVKVDNDGNLNL